MVPSGVHWPLANIWPRYILNDQIWSAPCAWSYISKKITNEKNFNWIQKVRRILTKVLLLFWCIAHQMVYCPLDSRFIFWSHMNFEMSDKIFFMFVSLAALVALELSLPCVRLYMLLQIRNASIVALITFERFFTGVLSHDVGFQITSLNARKLACCASVWLFSRVRLLVPLQVASTNCFVIA